MTSEYLSKEEERSLFSSYASCTEAIFDLLTSCPNLNEYLLQYGDTEEKNVSRLINRVIGVYVKNPGMYACLCGKECDVHLKIKIRELSRLKKRIIANSTNSVHACARFLESKNTLFHLEYDDLVQLGMYGLCNAVDLYDFNRDLRFNTYAMSWISGAIRNGIRHLDDVVRNTGIAAGSPNYAVELDCARHVPSPQKCFSISLEQHQLTKIILQIINEFPLRTVNILKMRFGFPPFSSCGASLDQIAAHFKISRERVRQIQVAAVNKLKKQLKTTESL